MQDKFKYLYLKYNHENKEIIFRNANTLLCMIKSLIQAPALLGKVGGDIQSNAKNIQCKIIQYSPTQCNTIPCNAIELYTIPCSTIELHTIQAPALLGKVGGEIQSNAKNIQCKIIQYSAIQYHAVQ